MRTLSLLLVGALVAACGNSSSSTPDGNGGDDDQSGDDGGGSNTPHTVKLTLTNRPTNAAMFSFIVAYQDGGAAWQLAPAPTGDTYTFPVNAPSYGVAFTCIANTVGTTTTQARTVTMAYFAVGERTELTLDVPDRCTDRNAAGNITLTGNVANRPQTGTLFVSWGKRSAFVGTQTGNFSLQAPPGTHDLFVVHAVPQGNGDFYTDDVWVERNVTFNTSGTKSIDFFDASFPQSFSINIGPLDANARVTSTTTLYANGTQTAITRETTNVDTQSLNGGQMENSDLYDISITVAQNGRAATVTHATAAPADVDWTTPAPLGLVQTIVAAPTPYVMLQSTWPAYAGVAGYTWAAVQQLNAQQCGANTACSTTWLASLSPGVTGSMPAFAMPDLSALTGWKPGFAIATGSAVVGSVTAYKSSVGPGDFPAGAPPANGTVRTFVRSDYTLTP